MNYISRDRDVIYKNNDLEDLYTFYKFPVFMGCTEEDISKDILEDMSWKISKKSGMIQLNPLLPLKVVYSKEHGSGTVGKLWNEHHKSFAEFISKYKPKTVLEIGGLHGILAKNYLNIDKVVDWTIIEPNPIVDKNLPIKVIEGFFDENFKLEKNFDAVVHSHVLEHVYNPEEFMKHKSSFTNEGDLLLFSVPNMKVMLENNYNNCINFEHTVYFSSPYIEYFLAKYNFEIIEKTYFKKDHSIFYCTKKVSKNLIIPPLKGLYNKNKKTFSKYINSHLKEVQEINNIIDNTSLPVYLFGAHIFAQYLIAFGLNTKKIVKILDNDYQKHNKRLYGTNLKVNSPKILKNKNKAIVILRAGVYNNEVKTDILKNINPNIKFI